MIKRINIEGAPKATGPYAHLTEANGMLFLSGQIALDPATNSVMAGDIKKQAIQVFENLKTVLEGAGSDLTQVIKTMCFLKDMNDFAIFNEVYNRYLGKHKPSRSCVEAARLPLDVLVEIELIALKK